MPTIPIPLTEGDITLLPLKTIAAKDQFHFFDCVEHSSATTTWRAEIPEFDLFSKRFETQHRYFLAEIGGWPFVVGFHAQDRMQPGRSVVVALRGEASGFHKSAATPALLRLLNRHTSIPLITLDEYRYLPRDKKNAKALAPICHRARYPERYIFTENPGFENGMGVRLIDSLVSEQNSIIIFSYSNATTPRNQLFERRIRENHSSVISDNMPADQILKQHLLSTHMPDNKFSRFRGFIDVEGDFEINKLFWDFLAFIKSEINRNPQRFFYSATRIEKSDAYAGHITMIRALQLSGVEDDRGVIRFKNKAGNIITQI